MKNVMDILGSSFWKPDLIVQQRIEVSFCWRISRHFRKFRTLHQVMILPAPSSCRSVAPGGRFVDSCRCRLRWRCLGVGWIPQGFVAWIPFPLTWPLQYPFAKSYKSKSLYEPVWICQIWCVYIYIFIYIQHTDWFGTFNGFAKLAELIVLQLRVCAKSKQIFTCVPYPVECRKAARRS